MSSLNNELINNYNKISPFPPEKKLIYNNNVVRNQNDNE